MTNAKLTRRRALQLGMAVPLIGVGGLAHADANSLLNVSYDPTAALYKDYDELFAAYWTKPAARRRPCSIPMVAPAPRPAPSSKAYRPMS